MVHLIELISNILKIYLKIKLIIIMFNVSEQGLFSFYFSPKVLKLSTK